VLLAGQDDSLAALACFSGPGSSLQQPLPECLTKLISMQGFPSADPRAAAPIQTAVSSPTMNHPIYGIISFEHVAPYKLRLCFDDSLCRTIDFESILETELFG
jgi:hypothetical protein